MTGAAPSDLALTRDGALAPAQAPPRQTALKRAVRVAAARPLLCAVSLGLYALVYALPLAPGLLQRAIFDTLSGRRPAHIDVWSLVGLWFASQIAPLAATYFAAWSFTVFTVASRAMVRTNLIGWMMFAPGPRPAARTAGEALSRFRDDVNEFITFIEGWSDTFGQGVFALLALAVMARIDAGVTLAIVAPMLAVVVITQRITAGIHKYSRAAREADARVTSFVGEMFTAIQAIRVAGAEARIVERLDRLNDARRATAVRHRVYVTLLDTFGVGVSSFALGLVLLVSASAMRGGRFTVGDFTLFAAYVGAATSAPRWLGRLMARKRTADVALMRIGSLLGDAPDAVLSAPAPIRPPVGPGLGPLETLEVEGLTVRRPGGGGIEDIDLEIRKGQIVIVTGRVGSGKTTLLRALLGLIPSDAGVVRWNGSPLADPSTVLTPPRCAYTPQTPRLFSESLRDNILMGWPADEEGLARAVRLGALDADVEQLESGLDTWVGTRGVTLSGGQVQRAAAARMFLRHPDLLVFDDVSSALDVRTERLLWERMFEGGRPTVLAVSHRLEALRRADLILLLEGGRVAARGRFRDLLESSPLFRTVWEETLRASHGAGSPH